MSDMSYNYHISDRCVLEILKVEEDFTLNIWKHSEQDGAELVQKVSNEQVYDIIDFLTEFTQDRGRDDQRSKK